MKTELNADFLRPQMAEFLQYGDSEWQDDSSWQECCDQPNTLGFVALREDRITVGPLILNENSVYFRVKYGCHFCRLLSCAAPAYRQRRRTGPSEDCRRRVQKALPRHTATEG